MARSLGSLVVSLGLNAAEFTTGLTKSEREAQKFARSIDKGIAAAVNVATIALAGLTAAAILGGRAFNALINQAGHFQDLAEKTGASAESLASFSIAAQVAGTSVDDLATFSVKLSKNLGSVDEESSKTALGLKALGIPIEKFKALDPAEQIDELAKALKQFNDIGGGKASALENIAKGGAALLPFLKELEESGGRQVTLTKEQIRQADQFADATARSKAQLNAYAQLAAVAASGPIAALTGAFQDYAKALIAVDGNINSLSANNKMEAWAENLARKAGFVVDIFEALARIVEVINAGGLFTKGGEAAVLRPTFGQVLEKRLDEMKRESALRRQEDRGFDPRPKLAIPGASGKAAADKISEGERLIESLQKQLEGLQDLTVAEKVLLDISLGRIKAVTHAEIDAALAIADQIDAKKAATKAEEERKRAEEEALRSEERVFEIQQRSIEAEKRNAESIKQGNESLREQLAFLKGGEEGLRAYTDAKLATAIADNIVKEAAAAAQGASEAQLEAIRATTAALKERQQITGELRLAEKLRDEAKALQDVKNMISDTFADAFTSFITGAKSAKDTFKSLADSIVQQISRIAAQNLANAIFGGTNQAGPDFFGVIAKLLGAFGGSTGTGVGGFETSGGFGAGEGFAMGGTTRGGWVRIGEQGPEEAKFPAGTRIRAAHNVTSGGGTVTNTWHVNVMPGATTATARQAAKEIERRVRSQSVRG